MSLKLYKQITEKAANELRRVAERFEATTEAADKLLRETLSEWEREMQEPTGEK